MFSEVFRRTIEVLLLGLLVGCTVWLSALAAWFVPY